MKIFNIQRKEHAFIILLTSASLISFIFLTLPSNAAYADTAVSTEISQNTTWTKANSPYVISGNPTVDAGVTLTIEAGVTLKFNNSSMTVFGNVIAQGTASNKITFTSVSGNQSSPSFLGVDFISGTATSSLSYVSVKNVSSEFFAYNSALDIENSAFDSGKSLSASGSFLNLNTVSFSSVNGPDLAVYNNSNASCLNCTFDGTNATGQSDVILAYNSSSLDLENSSIIHSGSNSAISAYGDSGSGPTVLTINNSTIDTGSGNGIIAFNSAKVTIASSSIQNFMKDGLEAYNSVELTISNSTIEKNSNGFDIWGDVTGSAAQNSIKSNISSGITSRSTIPFQAQNNWWGDPSGPFNVLQNATGTANSVSDNVNFIPWLTSDPNQQTKPICCSSVLFIPGLESSRLYVQGALFENQLWEPNDNNDSEILFMGKDGQSVNKAVYTRDIIKRTNYPAFNVDFYRTFSSSLDNLVSQKVINQWQAFPYDWRFSPEDVVKNGTALADNKLAKLIPILSELARNSQTGKVTIVTHSNGGLVAKALVTELQKEGKQDLVDNLVMVAAPQLGTPQDVGALLHGYGQSLLSGILLKTSVARQLGENMPAAYDLLPSKQYFSKTADPVVLFDSSIDSLSNLRKVYGNSISNQSSLDNFLEGSKDNREKPGISDTSLPNVLNAKLISDANNFHASSDSWKAPGNIHVIQIVGEGIQTVDGMEYYKKTSFLCLLTLCSSQDILDIKPVLVNHGDGIVIDSSASALSTTTYYIDLAGSNAALKENRSHADIMETAAVKDLVENIIQNKADLPAYVSINAPASIKNSNITNISIHSPVSLNILGLNGEHTGPVINADSDLDLYETQIPNSYYLPYGEGVYAGVDDSNGTSTIELNGLGTGTFTLDVQSGTNTTEFTDVPVLPTSVATLNVQGNSVSNMSVDLDGDGRQDLVVDPQGDFDPIAYLLSMETLINGFDVKDQLKANLDKKIDRVILGIQNGKIKKASNLIKKYMKGIESKTRHAKKIAEADQNTLISMLDTLLTNLSNP